LQELVQGSQQEPPSYRITDERGPDHDREFDAEVMVAGEVVADGTGSSKQEAEQAAARSALDAWVADREDDGAEGDGELA
jgi:ribonuclease-3